jgi:hypothetical protein
VAALTGFDPAPTVSPAATSAMDAIETRTLDFESAIFDIEDLSIRVIAMQARAAGGSEYSLCERRP